MKVYNVGFIPQITHTHNPRRALGVVCQQVNLPELHTKGIQDIMDEFVSAILHPVRDIEDSTLNRMYKSLRVGEERKIESLKIKFKAIFALIAVIFTICYQLS